MFGWAKIKMYAVAAVGIAITIGWAILYFIGLGKRSAQADQLENTLEESNELQDRINAGHNAGNRIPPGGVPNDPNDRANRRKNR